MPTDYRSLLSPVEEAFPRLGTLQAMLGFDGTVDIICKPVQNREGTGNRFTPFKQMKHFGERIVAADNKSALIEIVVAQEKIGGNGPIMARALASSGIGIDYVGAAGFPDLHPAYAALAKDIIFHSITNPAITHALEFENGKVMLCTLSNYEQVTAPRLQQIPGTETMTEIVRKARLCALLNWTCLPGWESILSWFLDDILTHIGHDPGRLFFFDLADPSMRSGDELRNVLELIASFEAFGQVVLGMNLNEAEQISRALGLAPPEAEHVSLKNALERIREKLEITMAMGHPVHCAACASREGSWSVDGPYTPTPSITTGAGDHLNAGFCLGLMLDFPPEEALKLGVLFSGYYVRTGEPPRLETIPDFIHQLNNTTAP